MGSEYQYGLATPLVQAIKTASDDTAKRLGGDGGKPLLHNTALGRFNSYITVLGGAMSDEKEPQETRSRGGRTYKPLFNVSELRQTIDSKTYQMLTTPKRATRRAEAIVASEVLGGTEPYSTTVGLKLGAKEKGKGR